MLIRGCIFLYFFMFWHLSFSQESNLEKGEASPLLVNIDSPQFRELIIAVPPFLIDESVSISERENIVLSAREGLVNLLHFSGLFKITHDDLSKDLLTLLKKSLKEKKSIFLSDPAQRNFDGIALEKWKAIGIESLTIGVLKQDGDRLYFELRTADVNRKEFVLGKRYWITKENFGEAMRAYGDWLLKTYTGKSGIFRSKIVFIGRREKKANKQVYICDFDGSNVRQITTAKSPHVSPSWSPDGRFLTFTSFEDGNPDLFLYDLEKGKKQKLSGVKGLNSGAHWSPDGELIALTGSKNGDADIYTIHRDGSRRSLLITGHGLDVDPAFSPNKKWMAFVSGRFGNPHIFVGTLKWEGKDKVRVIADRRITYAGWYNATPSWSPDSDKLAFAGYDRDIDRFDIFIVNPNGSRLERLTLRNGDNENPTWSPNGQLIAFQSTRTGNKNIKGPAKIYVMNRDGGGQREIPLPLYDAQTPEWSINIE